MYTFVKCSCYFEHPVVDLQNKVTCTTEIFTLNGLKMKTQEFTCIGNIFELFYLHKTNSACICAGKTPLNQTLNTLHVHKNVNHMPL